MLTHVGYCTVVLLVAAAWYFDHRQLDRRALEAECKYEMIDPIRAEAGAPLSDKCQCFWKEVSLEELRRMK